MDDFYKMKLHRLRASLDTLEKQIRDLLVESTPAWVEEEYLKSVENFLDGDIREFWTWLGTKAQRDLLQSLFNIEANPETIRSNVPSLGVAIEMEWQEDDFFLTPPQRDGGTRSRTIDRHGGAPEDGSA